ncbi:MAG TPA: hypothetical protein VGR71_06230 [Nitrospira sp.]|nr:hypothetical protein [Nitrospira sp.]
MAGKLFEFAILHHSRPTKAEEEQGKKPTTTILVEPRRIIANDESKALLLAAREIPVEYTDGKLDEIEVIMRPF